MRVHIGDNKLVVKTGQKIFHFDLPKDVDKSLIYEIDFIIKYNDLLTEHK